MNDAMNELWKQDNKRLEEKTLLNEELIRTVVLGKSSGDFNNLLKLSVFGRNVALFYGFMSIIFGIITLPKLAYAIPAFSGALAMVWSFYMHRSLKSVDVSKLSIVELQKHICKFRIHTAKTEKYDISIVSFWGISLAPAFIAWNFKVLLFNSIGLLLVFVVIATALVFITWIVSKYMYGYYAKTLKDSEEILQRVMAFEATESSS